MYFTDLGSEHTIITGLNSMRAHIDVDRNILSDRSEYGSSELGRTLSNAVGTNWHNFGVAYVHQL